MWRRAMVLAGIRVRRPRIVREVDTLVTGGEDEERVAARHRLDRVCERLGLVRATEAAVYDIGPVGARVVDRLKDVRVLELVESRAKGHDGDVLVDAGDADHVVADSADRPGDVRPVPVVVERRVVIFDEVPSGRTRDRMAPHVSSEIR